MREYVEGKSLYELKEESEFSREEIKEAGLALCKLVRQLHELEISLIHRDITNTLASLFGRSVL